MTIYLYGRADAGVPFLKLQMWSLLTHSMGFSTISPKKAEALMIEQEKGKKSFSIKNSIKEGWQLMRAHLGNLLFVQMIGILCLFAIFFVWGIFIFFLSKSSLNVEPMATIGNIVNYIIQFLTQSLVIIAGIHIGLKIVDGKEFTVSDLFSRANLVFRYFFSTICCQLAIVLGLICFIIPGLIMMVRFSLFGYFIVEKDVGPIEALKMSWNTVRGCSWRFVFFQLSCVLVNVAGFLCLVIGVLFTLPATVIATALVYRNLANQTYGNKPEEIPPSERV